MQTIQRVLHPLGGVIIETAGHIDIADTGSNHVVIGNGRLGHSSAHDVDSFNLATARSGNGYFDVTVTRSANLVAHFSRRLGMHQNAVNGIDAIAVTKSTAR